MLKLNIYAKLFNLIYYEVFYQLQKELVGKNQPFSFYSSFKADFIIYVPCVPMVL